ncbi:uncharacterized protein LOC143026490 [Oratosquilla oratoria]|uniref:uncharacterized protein LOC143026490 n=1 Tax=Oratosquilla oratoria TaxID=337810 RepID=UPI003F7771BA
MRRNDNTHLHINSPDKEGVIRMRALRPSPPITTQNHAPITKMPRQEEEQQTQQQQQQYNSAAALSPLFCLLASIVFSTFCIQSTVAAPGTRVTSSTVSLQITNDTKCLHGHYNAVRCICDPCWEGEDCSEYVDYYSPRFLIHSASVVVATNVSGTVYRAWSTDGDLGLTCPLGPGESARCPCAAVRYQLFARPGDYHFTIDTATGILSRNLKFQLEPSKTYSYKLLVRSVPVQGISHDIQYDLLDLGIYVSPDYIRKIPWT